MNILELLEFEEGYREKPYIDTLGYPTVGIGKRIGPKDAPIEMYEFKVSKLMAAMWLESEVVHVQKLIGKIPALSKLDRHSQKDRYIIIVSMAYQLGIAGLLKFKKMLLAIDKEDWVTAAAEAKDSLWYKQTPKRAERHCRVLAGESIKSVY